MPKKSLDHKVGKRRSPDLVTGFLSPTIILFFVINAFEQIKTPKKINHLGDGKKRDGTRRRVESPILTAMGAAARARFQKWSDNHGSY